LVLDEADRMVDMGFAPDLKRILRLMPRERQTLMFSATMPPDLNRVAQEALRQPARVDLAPPQRPAAGITQAVYPVPRHLKTDLLDSMLSRSEMSSVDRIREKRSTARTSSRETCSGSGTPWPRSTGTEARASASARSVI